MVPKWLEPSFAHQRFETSFTDSVGDFAGNVKKTRQFRGFELRNGRQSRPKTLTAWPSRPIRPQFLEMDAILDPRAGPQMRPPMAGMEEDFRDVPALRTDGQGPADGPQGEPLEHQDQAALPAEPGQRHLHLGRARPQRAPARLDQRAQERRPQWRPRHVSC